MFICPTRRQAELCMDRIRTLDMLCHSYLPTDVESIKNHLEHIHEVRKSVLEALMVALANGTQLLDVLRDLQIRGTLDSRPAHNYQAVSLGINWRERLRIVVLEQGCNGGYILCRNQRRKGWGASQILTFRPLFQNYFL